MALKNDQDHPAEVEADTDPQHAGEEEDGARHVLGPWAEADHEELIDALHPIAVVGSNEREGDHHARDDGADGQLTVEKGMGLESLRGSPKEGRRTRLRSDDRCEDRPPGDGAAAQGEFLQRRVTPSRPQSNGHDHPEIDQDHQCVGPDRQLRSGRQGEGEGKRKCHRESHGRGR